METLVGERYAEIDPEVHVAMTETLADPIFLPAGDTALVVQFGEAIDPEINHRVVRLAGALSVAAPEGVVDLVPTFRSLMIHYDPLLTSQSELRQVVMERLRDPGGERTELKRWRIPVCYGGEHGPDLASVSQTLGMTQEGLVRGHTGHEFEVFMMGFLPGHPYLGILPEAFDVPRLAEPRVKVPPRSISLAQRQSTIYPVECPGGWHLIGRSPVEFFDLRHDEPILLSAGDRVRFEAIMPSDYESLRQRVEVDAYRPPFESIK